MATTARIYDFRFRFVVGPHGWTETYRFACTSGLLADAARAADRLANLRIAFMGSSAVIDDGDIVPVAVLDAAAGVYVKPTDQGPVLLTTLYDAAYRGQVQKDMPDPNTCVDVRVSANNALYRRTLQLRGFAATDISFEPGDRAAVVKDPAMRTALSDFLKRLVNTDRDEAGVYVLRGKSHDPLVTLPNDILGAQIDPTGCYTILTLREDTRYFQGETVHVHAAFGCNSRGLNGDARVVLVGPSNLLTISKKASCCGAPLLEPRGEVTKVSRAYYALENVLGVESQVAPLPNRLRRRKTGRQRVAARGRGKKRCG